MEGGRIERWLARRDGAELWGVALLSAFVLVATAGPLAVSMVVSPAEIERGEVQLTPPCATLAATGAECASCGLTRGFCAMSRFRLADAAGYNAAAPWLYLAGWALALASAALLMLVGRAWRALPAGRAGVTTARSS